MQARGFRSRGLAVAFAVVFTCAASTPLCAQERGGAFVDVSIVRVEPGDVVPGQTVVVEGGRITRVGPAATTDVPRGAKAIDGRGLYLLPGLIHPAARIPAPGTARAEDVLLLYLARGVTTVRAPNDHPGHPDLAREIERGRFPGPRLLLVSPDSLQVELELQGDFGSNVLELLLAGSLADAPAAGARGELLPTLTTDAARVLGLVDEVAVRPGARADLVLLQGNPLEDLGNLGRIAGVMADGRWRTLADLEREAERRARTLVRDYGRIPSRTDLPPSCKGTTLHDCFGGEQRCASGSGCSREHLRLERAVLLGRLDLLGSIFPANDWIVGQRVNSSVENAQLARARAAADACLGTLWWCQALRGYALHRQWDPTAELRFDSAIANAPSGQLAWVQPGDPGFDDRTLLCEWHDLRYLIGGRMLDQYRQRPCGENRDFETRYWWLADPLWSEPGNSRRSEHLSRIVQMRLHDEQGDERGAHVQSHHVAVMPAGVPNSWRTITRQAGGVNDDRREIYVNGGYSFTPDEQRFLNPLASVADDWTVALDEGAERMITREVWYNLDHQAAVLRRQERLLLIASARPPRILASYDSVTATFVVSRVEDRHVEMIPGRIEDVGIVRATAELADVGWIASLEVRGSDWIGRARHGAPAPPLVDGFGMSDPLLMDERFETGLALSDAVLPSTQLSGRSRVGVYFEVYGAQTDEPLRVSVSAERTNRSFFRRLTGALRLTTEASVDVNWVEAAETGSGGWMPRYLTVDLSGLNEGDYRLTVQVQRASGVTATSGRVIRLER